MSATLSFVWRTSTLVLALAACTPQRPPLPPADPPPDLTLTQVTVRQYRGSVTQLVATAPSAGIDRVGPTAGRLTASEVVVDAAVNGLHLEVASVTGDALTGSLTGTTVRATVGASVVTSPVAHFERQEGEAGTASTDAGVHLDSPRFVLDAQRGTFDLATEKADLDVITTTTK